MLDIFEGDRIKNQDSLNAFINNKLAPEDAYFSQHYAGYSTPCKEIGKICQGCDKKIQERYLMKIDEQSWHEHCLACCTCGVLLSASCYSRNNKIYCKADYHRLFGIKCSRCRNEILPEDLVMRAQNYVYHIACFVCIICDQPLQKGEQFVLRDEGKLLCITDIEKEMFLLNRASSESMTMDENCQSRDGRRGPKRPRTILTSIQRKQFKTSFEVSPKPCRKVREALARDTGLNVRVVQVWFQNQRAKMKKIQRKVKHESDKNGEKSSQTDSNTKPDSAATDHKHYFNDANDNGYGSNNSGSQPLNPNNPYSPDGTYIGDHSVESFYSSELSMDGSPNTDETGTCDTLSHDSSIQQKTKEDSTTYQSQELCQTNPIDKLYLMQNSYFNSDQ